MAQDNTKSIWLYIKPRGNVYQFVKRWPKAVEHIYGRHPDRKSLGVKMGDKREAEIKAGELLAIHNAKVKAAKEGRPFYDLNDITTIDQMPEETRAIIDRLTQVSQIQLPQSIIPAMGDVGPFAYIDAYVEMQGGDLRGTLHNELARNAIHIDPNSPLFKAIYQRYWQDKLKTVASFERFRRIEDAKKIPTNDIDAFENAVFHKSPDDKQVKPAPRLSVFAEIYKKKYTTGRQGKELSDKNKAQIATVLRWFISAMEDEYINRIKSPDITDFFDDLREFPAGHHLMKNNTLTFREMLELEGERYEKKLSRETAKDYWQILFKFFTKARIEYKDAFKIENPFDDLKLDDYVKGRGSKETRAWLPSELTKLFSFEKFHDLSFDNQFAWCSIFGLFHGNRMSELTRREVDCVMQNEAGIWYLDIPKGKTPSATRMIPIHNFLLKIGFLDYVEYRKVRGEEYLFDTTFANSLSSAFNQWTARNGLYDESRTFHQLRSSWVTASERIEMRASVARYIAGHAGGDVHDRIYKNTWLDTTKKAIDQIVIEGFPYDKFEAVVQVA